MTRFPIVVKKEGCAVSNLSWCELIGKTSLSFLFLLGLEFLEPQRFIIRTISNIVRHIFILNLWDRKFPLNYFISVAMAQEISRTKHWFLTFAVKIFLFGAMRDNGDDAFGEPLSRVDRPVHISSTSTSSISTPFVTNPISPAIGSSLSTSTPLDLFMVAVQRALDSGLSKETLIANIYLISDERSTTVQPPSSDEFFSQ